METLDPLTQYGPYAFIPYSSSANTDVGTEPLTVNFTSTWTYCGPLLSGSPDSLPKNFHTWAYKAFSTKPAFLARLLPLLSHLETFLPTVGAQHYWITIRATKPTNEFDMPRWHTDDIFFGLPTREEMEALASTSKKSATTHTCASHSSSPRYWKLCTTLLGPSTLFLSNTEHALSTLRARKIAEQDPEDPHTCTSMRCMRCQDASQRIRETLADCLASEPMESPAHGEVAFFRVGDDEGAVHSEPPCTEDRIFINVVPGTEEELKGLMRRWGMEFPRAWCLGVPVGADDLSVEGMEGDVPTTDTLGTAGKRQTEKCEAVGEERGAGAFSANTWESMATNLKCACTNWLKQKV